MKKYWGLSIVFFATLLVSTVVFRTEAINSGLVLGESTEAPIRKLTETARKSTINPTDYIKRLTETPLRTLKKDAQSKTPKPTPNLTNMAERKQKLEDKKLKLCQEKSANILKRSTQLGEKAQAMKEKFSSVVESIKAYYIKKGLSVTAYAELIAAIETKKSAITALLETAKTDLAQFSCTGDNPSEQLQKHRIDMEAVQTALHEYRLAIKNLIDAIKNSAQPTGIPTVTP